MFVRYWCLCESYVKALGVGISGRPFRNFDIAVTEKRNDDDEREDISLFESDPETFGRWRFQLFRETPTIKVKEDERSIVAVCVEDDEDEDGDTNTTHQAALAVGKSQPPVTNPQGISFPRSSHGGSGKRLPGVKEHGLEQDVEILRAALWKASDDQVHASSPVKLRRLEAETEGYERSPMQLAPPGKGFVESCGDVVTLKVIDYDNDGDDSDDEEEEIVMNAMMNTHHGLIGAALNNMYE